MILIILAWVYCFLISLSIGAGIVKLISKVVGTSLNKEYGIFYQFWFGFVILVGLLQVLSLFLPVHNIAFIIISFLAVAFAVINSKSVFAQLTLFYKWLGTIKGIVSFISICIILILVSYSANREVINGDTFLYHFNGVKWAREYPAVPGLANLHSRLGFNSSFFLFAAFTEVGVYANNSAYIALPFLVAACTVHWFLIIFNPRELTSKRIFCMLTSLYLLIRVVTQIDIVSLSADFPMAILTLVFALILVDKLGHKAILLLPLSALILSFKLSGLVATGISVIILLGQIFMLKYGKGNRRIELKTTYISIVLFCFIVSGFIIRNVIVSGWLLFPLPVGNLHLPWSVPKPYVLDLMAWIKSYGKIPGGASPESLAGKGFFHWFPQWFNKFKTLMEYDMLCASFFILLWSIFQTKSFPRFIYAHLNILLLILFALVSILFWFVSAPDVRFGSVSFFILFAGSIVLLFEGNRYKGALMNLITAFFIFQIVYRIPSYFYHSTPNLFTFAYTKPRKLVKVIASPPDEAPALFIYMPAEGDACGDSPLPCTPYAGGFLHNHRLIRQRVPGDLSKGFLPTE